MGAAALAHEVIGEELMVCALLTESVHAEKRYAKELWFNRKFNQRN